MRGSIESKQGGVEAFKRMQTANPRSDPTSIQAAKNPYRTFEDWEVYHAAREFGKAMYAVGRRLPTFEKFELASQIRRAAVSLANNIAEGHGRYHYLDQIKFCLPSRGSLEALSADLKVCENESYLPPLEVTRLKDQAWRVHRLLNGYIRWLRGRKQGAELALHESAPAYGLTEADRDDLLAKPPPSTTAPL